METGTGFKSQIENARQDGVGRGEWREEGGLKSQIEIAWDHVMWRESGEEDGGLKLQIENAGEERMGRGGCRGEEGLKSQIENAVEEGMRPVARKSFQSVRPVPYGIHSDNMEIDTLRKQSWLTELSVGPDLWGFVERARECGIVSGHSAKTWDDFYQQEHLSRA